MKHHRKSNRYTDVVQVDDVLGSMAESLMERQPKSFKPKLVFQDKKVAFKIGGKPPREIFYRKTSTFLTKLPPPVPSKLCSCAFLCSGSPATIKCHSCSIYDPSGCAFFCDLCFRARHPWHRIPHVYTAIQADESIEHTLKISHRIAEAKRYEQEGSDILRTLLEEKAKLAIVGDDEKLDNQMWDYGRRMVALEQYVMNLRKKIHEDTYQHSLRKSLVVDSSEMKQLEQFRQSQMLKDLLENFNASLQLAAEKEKEKERERESTLVVYRPEIGEVEIAEGEVEGSESVAEGERREVGPSSEVIEDVIPEVIVVSEVTAAEPETVEMGVVPGSAEEVPEETAQSSADPDPVNDPGPGPDPGPNPVDKLATGPVVPAPAYVPAFDPIPAPVDPEVTHAATCVQKVFKAFVARRIVSSVLATRVVRVWSPQYARDYFYDRVSGVSSWTPSKLLRKEHLEDLIYTTESNGSAKWSCKTSSGMVKKSRRLSTMSVVRAVSIMQNFARCVLARRRLVQKANTCYRRVLDDDSGTWYYANVVTGETSWQKPSFFLSQEPPVLLREESSRRSPRVQRMSASWT